MILSIILWSILLMLAIIGTILGVLAFSAGLLVTAFTIRVLLLCLQYFFATFKKTS